MITECPYRLTLEKVLQSPGSNLSMLHLVHILRGVACGMRYLSDLGYIHKVRILKFIPRKSQNWFIYFGEHWWKYPTQECRNALLKKLTSSTWSIYVRCKLKIASTKIGLTFPWKRTLHILVRQHIAHQIQNTRSYIHNNNNYNCEHSYVS